MILKVTDLTPTGNKSQELVIPLIRFKSIFNLEYQELFYDSWFELCKELYHRIITTIKTNGWDIYVEDAYSTINIKLYIHPLTLTIEPRLIY